MRKIELLLLHFSIILCLCTHMFCLFFYGMQPYSIRKNVKEGKPFVFKRDEDYFCEIQRVRITDEYVYVQYGGKSIVKVYQHDGTYMGTIAVYDRRGSGGTDIYTDNEKAYIYHGNCLYEFSGIEFLHCYYNSDMNKKLQTVSTSRIPARDYSLRLGNLIKYENTPREFVFVKRGVLQRLAYPGILLPFELFMFLLWRAWFKYH